MVSKFVVGNLKRSVEIWLLAISLLICDQGTDYKTERQMFGALGMSRPEPMT